MKQFPTFPWVKVGIINVSNFCSKIIANVAVVVILSSDNPIYFNPKMLWTVPLKVWNFLKSYLKH